MDQARSNSDVAQVYGEEVRGYFFCLVLSASIEEQSERVKQRDVKA